MKNWENGQTEDAIKKFRGSIQVTRAMVLAAISILRSLEVLYLIAPFEADAQITYLVNSGFCDAAITEDSDLIVFGCKKVLNFFFSINLTQLSQWFSRHFARFGHARDTNAHTVQLLIIGTSIHFCN